MASLFRAKNGLNLICYRRDHANRAWLDVEILILVTSCQMYVRVKIRIKIDPEWFYLNFQFFMLWNSCQKKKKKSIWTKISQFYYWQGSWAIFFGQNLCFYSSASSSAYAQKVDHVECKKTNSAYHGFGQA